MEISNFPVLARKRTLQESLSLYAQKRGRKGKRTEFPWEDIQEMFYEVPEVGVEEYLFRHFLFACFLCFVLFVSFVLTFPPFQIVKQKAKEKDTLFYYLLRESTGNVKMAPALTESQDVSYEEMRLGYILRQQCSPCEGAKEVTMEEIDEEVQREKERKVGIAP